MLAVGIWEHLKPGQFSMIHGTKVEIDGGKCDHATDKAAHLDHYKPDLPPHVTLVVGKKGRAAGLKVSAPPTNVGRDIVDVGAMLAVPKNVI